MSGDIFALTYRSGHMPGTYHPGHMARTYICCICQIHSVRDISVTSSGHWTCQVVTSRDRFFVRFWHMSGHGTCSEMTSIVVRVLVTFHHPVNVVDEGRMF